MSLNMCCLQYHNVQDTKLAGSRYKKQSKANKNKAKQANKQKNKKQLHTNPKQ